MAKKVSPAFHRGYAAALSKVHQAIGAHLAHLEGGGAPMMQPITAAPGPMPGVPSGLPSSNAGMPASMRPTPAFPYGRPAGR